MKPENKATMNYNLSEWALKNKGLILYFMLLLAIVGIVSYSKLAQSEDPPTGFIPPSRALLCIAFRPTLNPAAVPVLFGRHASSSRHLSPSAPSRPA